MLDVYMFILYLFSFIFGICIGSFLNVVIYRVPKEISVAKGRSFCPFCKEQIKFYDNIPLFSWMFLRGKCRKCKSPISIRYPIVELLGGITAVLCSYRFGLFTLKTLVAFCATAILISVAYIDHDTMTIPNGLNIALIFPSIAAIFVFKEVDILERVIGFFCVSLLLLIITLLINGAFGGGDIKLMAVAGFMLGYKNILVAFMIGIIITGFYAIIKVVLKKVSKKDHMAFGPGLCIGIFTAMLYGNQILDWYLNLCMR